MPVILPLQPSIPDYRVGTVLDGVQYILDVRWNARDAAWYLDILAEDETPIARGIKVVLGTILGARCAHADFPPGALQARDSTGSGVDAGFTDLGDRVQVVYFSPEEL